MHAQDLHEPKGDTIWTKHQVNQEDTQVWQNKGCPNYIKTQINTWFKIPIETKSNQHIIDEIPIGKRYQLNIYQGMRYQTEPSTLFMMAQSTKSKR